MSKFFDGVRQESSELKTRQSVTLPAADALLTELQESGEAPLPNHELSVDFDFGEVREQFESRTLPTKIRQGTGGYQKVALPQNTKVLAANDSLSDAAADSYRRIRTRLIQQRSNGKFQMVAVTSAVQGEGKTLTAVNLALCCSQLADFKVLLLDADLRTQGCSDVLGISSRPGLAEVLASVLTCSEAIAATDHPNFYVLSAGRAALPPPELFADSAWIEFSAWASRQFDLVIVDAPPVLPVPDFELIGAACERVILVARPFLTQNKQLERTLARIDRSKFAGVVLNGSSSGVRSYYYPGPYNSKRTK